jgi:hypothetical protein
MVCVSGRAGYGTVLAPSNIEVVGSNPAWGMDVCPYYFVLYRPVKIEALRWTDFPIQGFLTKYLNGFIFSEDNFDLEESERS